MNINVEFTENLRLFLISKQYSHLHNIGIVNSDTDDYLLRPLKAEDPRLNYEEAEINTEPINSTEVIQMAAGVDQIRFLIEISSEEFQDYLAVE